MMSSEGVKEMQLTMIPISMSEDCLYLNIYTPVHAQEGSNLPVSVTLWSSGEQAIYFSGRWEGKNNSELHCSLGPATLVGKSI